MGPTLPPDSSRPCPRIPSGPVNATEAFALEIAAEWTFHPSTKGGRPRSQAIVIPVRLARDADSAQTDVLLEGTTMENLGYSPLDPTQLPEEQTDSRSPVDSTGPQPEITPVVLRKGFWPATQGLDLRRDFEMEVGAMVDTSGYVTETWLLRTLAMEPLMESARRAARKWKFSPAVKDGEPTRSKIIIPFEFRLN
jgi:TonB family protein